MNNHYPDNIFFIGFMGTGKSCLSQLLSDKIGYGLLDTDAEIVKQAGRPISEIFATDGEAAFRRMETEMLQRLKADEIARFVVSCGGGIVTRPENVEIMREMGKIVLLTATVDEILARTSRDRSRPLLQTSDPRKRVEELLTARDSLYRSAADITIDTTGQEPEQIVTQLLHQLTLNSSLKPSSGGA